MRKERAGILFKCAVTGICIGLFLKLFVVDIMRVTGDSMEPALHDGNLVVINKLAYGLVIPFSSRLLIQWASPKKGDIVIYLYNDNYVIKRCCATGSIPLEYSNDSQYTLIVEGEKYPLSERQYHLMYESKSVPYGTILAIGDNHSVSVDSRSYGFVPEKNILGKALCR